MAIRSDDITTIIKSAIDQFDAGIETRSVGTVVEAGDGIAHIYGLADALASELVEFRDGVMGMALNLEEETVGAVILGDYTDDQEGDEGQDDRSRRQVPVGEALIGRVVDALASRLTTRARCHDKRPVERIAPGVIVRKAWIRRCRPASRRSTRSSRSAAASAS